MVDHKLENLHTMSGIYKLFKGMHPDTSMSSDAKFSNNGKITFVCVG